MPDPSARLPDWPAVLHEEWAAAYLSLSPATFRAVVMPQVKPIRLTERRQGWLRSDLDKWIAARANPESSSDKGNGWDNVWSSSD